MAEVGESNRATTASSLAQLQAENALLLQRLESTQQALSQALELNMAKTVEEKETLLAELHRQSSLSPSSAPLFIPSSSTLFQSDLTLARFTVSPVISTVSSATEGDREEEHTQNQHLPSNPPSVLLNPPSIAVSRPSTSSPFMQSAIVLPPEFTKYRSNQDVPSLHQLLDSLVDMYSQQCRESKRLKFELDVATGHLTMARNENAQLKQETVRRQSQSEMSEELISNRLLRRITELKREKTELMRRVALEEEMLAKTLNAKLAKLQKEKVDLEIEMETEQEFIVNRLTKQLDAALSSPKTVPVGGTTTSTVYEVPSRRTEVMDHIHQYNTNMSHLYSGMMEKLKECAPECVEQFPSSCPSFNLDILPLVDHYHRSRSSSRSLPRIS